MSKIYKGDIWIMHLDPTVGREQAKTRPCLVVSANGFNHSASGLVIAIPITSKNKNIPIHISIEPGVGGLKVKSYLMCEQIRSVSIKRIDNYLGRVEEDILVEIENMLKRLLDFY